MQDWIAKGVGTEGGSKSEPQGVPVQGAETEEEDTGKGLEECPGKKEEQQERVVSWKLSVSRRREGPHKRTTGNQPSLKQRGGLVRGQTGTGAREEDARRSGASGREQLLQKGTRVVWKWLGWEK